MRVDALARVGDGDEVLAAPGRAGCRRGCSSSSCQKWARKQRLGRRARLGCDQVERLRRVGGVGRGADGVGIGRVEDAHRDARRRPAATSCASTSGASDEPPMPHTTAPTKPSSRTPSAKASSTSTSSAKRAGSVEPAEAVADQRGDVLVVCPDDGSRAQMRSTQSSSMRARRARSSIGSAQLGGNRCGRRPRPRRSSAVAAAIGSAAPRSRSLRRRRLPRRRCRRRQLLLGRRRARHVRTASDAAVDGDAGLARAPTGPPRRCRPPASGPRR